MPGGIGSESLVGRAAGGQGGRAKLTTSNSSETLRLLAAYRESGDASMKATLVANYEPLVRRLCRKFSSSREPQDDLFQVGIIGLLNSIEKFDPQRGSSFSSLAIPEIMGAILNPDFPDTLELRLACP